MKRLLLVSLVIGFAGTAAAMWSWLPPGVGLTSGRHRFTVNSALTAELRWATAGETMYIHQFVRHVDRAMQIWNRQARTDIALEVNPTPSSTVPPGVVQDGTHAITYEDMICPGPTCCETPGLCVWAHTWLHPNRECDIAFIGSGCVNVNPLCPPNCGKPFYPPCPKGCGDLCVGRLGPANNAGRGMQVWPAIGGPPPIFVAHRVIMHEFVHCFGALDYPSQDDPPCVGGGTAVEGPIGCQRPGSASREPTTEDIDSMRSSNGYTAANLVAVEYMSARISSAGSVTISGKQPFTRRAGVPAPLSITPPRIACGGDQNVPDCVMVTTERYTDPVFPYLPKDGAIRLWTMDDMSWQDGPQMELTTHQLIPPQNGRTLIGPDIAFSRVGRTYGSAVVVWSNPDTFLIQYARWNMDNLTFPGFATVSPAGGTLSKSEPRVVFDSATGRFVIAFVDSQHQMQFMVSNGGDAAAAGFAFGPPRRAGPYVNLRPGGSVAEFSFDGIDDVAPLGSFDIACPVHNHGATSCRLVYHGYTSATDDKEAAVTVCAFTVNANAQTIAGSSCQRSGTPLAGMVVGLSDYKSYASGTLPGPLWTLSVGNTSPGDNENSRLIRDVSTGSFNPPVLVDTHFNIPSSSSRFRWGGVAGDFCEWTGCSSIVMPTLTCDPSFPGECL